MSVGRPSSVAKDCFKGHRRISDWNLIKISRNALHMTSLTAAQIPCEDILHKLRELTYFVFIKQQNLGQVCQAELI